jgi:hypothetical protein
MRRLALAVGTMVICLAAGVAILAMADDRAGARSPGLVAYFGFDGAAGGRAALRDASGAGNHAAGQRVRLGKGRHGTGVIFGGRRSRVVVADDDRLDVAGAMTVEAWVRPRARAGTRTVVAKVGEDSAAYAIHGATEAGGALGEARIGGVSRRVRVAGDLRLGKWTHMALTYDGARLRLYLNGRRAGSVQARGSVTPTGGPLQLGAGPRGQGRFRGVIDEVRVYDRALPQREILADMRRRAVPAAPAAPAAPPPQPPAASPSGLPGDPPGWREIFADDFLTDVPEGTWTGCNRDTRRCSGLPPAVRNKWYSYPEGYRDTTGDGEYLPSQVQSIGDSMLRLRMRSEGGRVKVAAPIPLLPAADSVNGALHYGRYAIRFRTDPTPGYKLAWLMWPESGDASEGVINFPEGNLDGNINGFMHYRGATSDDQQDAYGNSVKMAAGWHTVVLEWTPGSVRYILDDRVIGTSTSRTPSTPLTLVLQSETALYDVRPAPGSQANVYLDWIKIWAPAGR